MRLSVQVLQIGLLTMVCFAEGTPPKPGAKIFGSVLDTAGAAVAVGTVTLTVSGSNQRQIESIKAGQYEANGLDASKKHDLLVEAPGYHSASEKDVALGVDQSLRVDIKLSPVEDAVIASETDWDRINAALGALFLYLVSVLVTRWYKIAKPSRNFLLGHIESLRNDLQANRRPANMRRVADLDTQLMKIQEQYKKPKHLMLQCLFWSQSLENASWMEVHEIERELAAYLSPPEAVHTSLITASARLKVFRAGAARQIAAAIDAELNASRPNEKFRSQLLAEATSMMHRHSDENFTTLMDWQNKAMWLIFLSSLLLMLLAAAADNVLLFLAGAAGGLLSRLMRTLQRSSAPIDYGASWTTLFLSPLFGALCGWFGVGMIVLLAKPQVGLLGKMFTLVTWGHPPSLSTLTVAFVLGFSERLFNSLVAAVDEQATTGASPAAGNAQPPAPNVPPSPSPAPSQGAAGEYDALRQKVAGAIGSGNAADKAKVVAFLVGMGQEASDSMTSDALKQIEAKVEGLVGTDTSRQNRYVSTARAKGFQAS